MAVVERRSFGSFACTRSVVGLGPELKSRSPLTGVTFDRPRRPCSGSDLLGASRYVFLPDPRDFRTAPLPKVVG